MHTATLRDDIQCVTSDLMLHSIVQRDAKTTIRWEPKVGAWQAVISLDGDSEKMDSKLAKFRSGLGITHKV